MARSWQLWKNYNIKSDAIRNMQREIELRLETRRKGVLACSIRRTGVSEATITIEAISADNTAVTEVFAARHGNRVLVQDFGIVTCTRFEYLLSFPRRFKAVVT